MNPYIKLGIAALLPAVTSIIIYLVDKYTPMNKLNHKVKQVIIGLIFGALAIVGTEWGIPINGAQMNCRDAAVLIAGLFFGAPAGIIAGVIGAAERWIAVAWGVGRFTRIACTVSTFAAGIYSALLRRKMFENKKPGWMISLAIGVVMEVFHLTMVFITNMSTPIEAMNVVKICTVPMITANALSVMISAIFITVISGEHFFSKKENVRISQTIQRWLFITVLLAFVTTSYFVFSFQNKIALSQTDTLLDMASAEIADDILDSSDKYLMNITKSIKGDIDSVPLKELTGKYDVTEISIINKNGIIVKSSDNSYIGFDMKSGEQSKEFMCLLGDTEEYVQSYGPISMDESIMRKYAGIKYNDGFIQVGYDAEHFQKDIDKSVIGIADNRHVGTTGFVLVFNEKLELVSYSKTTDIDKLNRETERMKIPEMGKTFELSLNGSPCFCRYITSEGYYIVSVLPTDEAMQMRNIAVFVNTFMEILVFAILFALIYMLIKKVVVDQIKKINRSLSKITNGNLSEVVDVRSNEEFASLSDDINSTVDTLKHYIDEASARIDKELEFAKDIQTSVLPGTFPAFPKHKDFDIYALMDPAKEVGGDFYDFYMTGNDRLNFLVADVSGKGIPAAMFMMRAKTELKTLTESELPINEVFTQGNEALCEGNETRMFVTAWQGGIDLTSGKVRFANAGHNPPLVRRGDGKFEFLRTRPGFVLAGMEGIKYKTQELDLEPGDIIFLYTDGVTEATNANTELYGEERLLNALNAMEFKSMQTLCEYVKADVESFVGSAPQFDDITMVAFRYIGTPPAPSISFEKASIDDINAVTAFAEEELEKMGCPMKAMIQINVAIDEIYSNIVKYGYPDTPGPVTVKFIRQEDPDGVMIRFEDDGVAYNPLKKEDPDITLSAEERNIGGLGIFVVKKTMDDMKYEYENERNILTLFKRF